MWRTWWDPNNASKGQMGFNSAFKGLTPELVCPFKTASSKWTANNHDRQQYLHEWWQTYERKHSHEIYIHNSNQCARWKTHQKGRKRHIFNKLAQKIPKIKYYSEENANRPLRWKWWGGGALKHNSTKNHCLLLHMDTILTHQLTNSATTQAWELLPHSKKCRHKCIPWFI